jgi:hypothetical protein
VPGRVAGAGADYRRAPARARGRAAPPAVPNRPAHAAQHPRGQRLAARTTSPPPVRRTRHRPTPSTKIHPPPAAPVGELTATTQPARLWVTPSASRRVRHLPRRRHSGRMASVRRSAHHTPLIRHAPHTRHKSAPSASSVAQTCHTRHAPHTHHAPHTRHTHPSRPSRFARSAPATPRTSHRPSPRRQQPRTKHQAPRTFSFAAIRVHSRLLSPHPRASQASATKNQEPRTKNHPRRTPPPTAARTGWLPTRATPDPQAPHLTPLHHHRSRPILAPRARSTRLARFQSPSTCHAASHIRVLPFATSRNSWQTPFICDMTTQSFAHAMYQPKVRHSSQTPQNEYDAHST